MKNLEFLDNSKSNPEEESKEEKIEEKDSVKTGYKSFKDIPEYPENHKGYSKYESMLEFKEKEENNIENPEVLGYDKAIKEIISNKEEENKTALSIARKITKNKAFKAAVLSLMLLTKVGGVSAENFKGDKLEKEDKIELNQENQNEINENKDNYISEYNEFKESVKLKADNYFETDKAEISPENQEKLEDDFHKFLNTIDENNYEDIIGKQWTIKGSSDERETNNWENGNESLTQARIGSVKSILEETLENHDFSDQLEAKQALKLKEKEISEKYPTSNEENKENGVTYLTDLINEETGKKYTESEIDNLKENNPKEYNELLESCRFTNFEVESNFFELDRFDKVHFLVDESGSMTASKNFISNELKEIEYNKPVELYSYSDLLNPDRMENCENSVEASEKIKQQIEEGSFRERQIDATLGLVNKISAENKENGKVELQKIHVATDEALQEVSLGDLELLQTKADQNNIEVEFLIGHKEELSDYDQKETKAEVFKLSLEKLIEHVKGLSEDEKIRNLKEQKENQGDMKIDEFYQSKYQESANDFESWAENSHKNKTDAFFKILENKGFGENPSEIRENLEKEFSGAKNYKKLSEFINQTIKENISGVNDYKQLIRLSSMGGVSYETRSLADALKQIAIPLRELIEAKNKLSLIEEATEDMDSQDLPNMKDNIKLKNIKSIPGQEISSELPNIGPTDLLSNFEY
ncbi:hypothetical protein K9M50_03270 [Patescibacteria group bacterium]|nr:hypothetical protein [Patescibacteria group bacterium]